MFVTCSIQAEILLNEEFLPHTIHKCCSLLAIHVHVVIFKKTLIARNMKYI